MSLRSKVSVIRESVSDREFELLLRRASQCMKTAQPRPLKKVVPVHRPRAS